jgi:hypothetical protein
MGLARRGGGAAPAAAGDGATHILPNSDERCLTDGHLVAVVARLPLLQELVLDVVELIWPDVLRVIGEHPRRLVKLDVHLQCD